MGARGRKSKAEIEVRKAAPVERIERPRPPAHLTDEQAAEWRQVVESLPADWFPPETHVLLEQYCRHAVAGRRIAQMIAQLEGDKKGFDLETYDQLLKMQEREGRALSSLATRMRITQQTRYDKARKRGPSAPKPWENWGAEEA